MSSDGMKQAARPILDEMTVVIPTLGRDILAHCLQSIVEGEVWPAQLILVDQGSSPAVAEWADSLRGLGIAVEHLRSAQRGRAAGVNRGLERVTTRFVAVTDDDCLVAHDWLPAMTACLRKNPNAIVTGRVEAAGDSAVLAVVTSRTLRIYRRPGLKHDAMSGGNMGAAMDVIRLIGPFDEDPCLATAEDGEYSYRALRRGVAIIYAPEVLVHHVGWRDPSERAAQYRSYARSYAGFLGKYLRRGDLFIATRTLVRLGRALKRWLRGIVNRDSELILHGRAHVLGLAPGLVAGWRSRHALVNGRERTEPVTQLTAHVPGSARKR